MKQPVKIVSDNVGRQMSRSAPTPTIVQRHRAGPCRTPARIHGAVRPGAVGPSNPQLSPAVGRSPGSVAAKTPGRYSVQMPRPMARGSQQIRATIHGTPHVAGSIEIRATGKNAYISNLQVDQQHRRRGVAAKLIDAAVATARRQGFKAATLEARPSDNGISPQALVAMYQRQGFRNIGKSRRGSPLMERKL